MVFLKVGLCGVFRVNNVIIRTGSRLLVIYRKNIDGRRVGRWTRFSLYIPQAQVLENLFNHTRVLYESNDPHSTGTLGAYEGVDLIYFLNEPSPVLSESLVGQFWFEDAGGGETLKNPRMSVWQQPHRAQPLNPARRLCKRLSEPPSHND